MFSIIIPVYNASATLDRCVESVRRQSCQEWELILVDDGSTDGADKMCQDWAATDRRIKCIRQDNAGPAAARNRGMEVAQGDWLLFVDADDWIDTDYVAHYQSAITAPDVLPVGRATEHDGDSLYFSLPMERFSSPCAHCYNAHIIKEHNLQFPEELTCGEDAVFNLRYCQYVRSVVDVEYYGYHRIVYPHSLSHRNGPHALWESIVALESCRTSMPYIVRSDFYNKFVQSRINIRCRDILSALYPVGLRRERLAWLRLLFTSVRDVELRFLPQFASERMARQALLKRQYSIADLFLWIGTRLRQRRQH